MLFRSLRTGLGTQRCAAEAVSGELDVAATLARRTGLTHDWNDASQVEWLEGLARMQQGPWPIVAVVALGGSSPLSEVGMGAFQEIDQVAVMKPVTKWAERVHEARRIPELVSTAFRRATSGKPGPVYLDFPGDVLHHAVDDANVIWPTPVAQVAPACADAASVEQAIGMLSKAQRPVIVYGSGALWSRAGAAPRAWPAGMPRPRPSSGATCGC